MTTILLSFIVVSVLMAAMAIGVLMGRKPLSGSCGGLAAVGIDGDCEICGGNPAKCDAEQERIAADSKTEVKRKPATFYDAS